MNRILRISIKPVFAILLLLCFGSCQNQKSEDIVVDDSVFEEEFLNEHNAQNSLDFQGTYFGILPCADCEGIETTIEIGPGNSYTRSIVYLNNDNQSQQTSTGTFEWNEGGNIITLTQEDKPNQYFVGENVLFHLDMDGNRIEGSLADKYTLIKQ